MQQSEPHGPHFPECWSSQYDVPIHEVIYRVYISGARGNNSQGRCKTISREVLTSSHLPSKARHGGFLAMFPEGGNTSKHSFLAMFFEGGQTRKQYFFVMFTKCGQSFSAIFSSNVSQSGKQCFLVMFTEMWAKFLRHIF